ncbi:hypothetical protein AM391_RS23660 [Kluyvera ascorbata]|nr:hypothetical protein [Kluyvera ascorbata]
MSDFSIITSTELYVKQCEEQGKKRKRQVRFKRAQIPTCEVDPAMRSFGRHIVKAATNQRSVRIPAMQGSEWGYVLRALEMIRSFN